MKKAFAAFLCALLMLGLISVSSPGALAMSATGYYDIYPSKAYIGETLTWKVTLPESNTYELTYVFRKDGQVILTAGPTSQREYSIKADSAGTYSCVITAERVGYQTETVLDQANVAIVSSWPAAKITKVDVVSGTSLKLSWKAIAGAKAYRLYRSLSKTGPYSYVRSTTGLSVADTGLRPGVRYFYKLSFLSAQGNWSPLGAYAIGIPVARAAITSAASPAKGQVKLVWAKTPGATGYQVLLGSAASGPYRVVRTLPGTTVTFLGLKSGSRMFFQVRPYHKYYTAVYYGLSSPYRLVVVK